MKNYVEKCVKARPNFCVPAVLEMVLQHYGISGFSQDDIAKQLNIFDADDNVDHRMWGAQIGNDTLNIFFATNHIQLEESYIPINHIIDDLFMGEIIKNKLSQNSSIICGYTYTWLFGSCEDTYGHVSIIVEYDEISNQIVLLDPGPKESGYKKVHAEDLFRAIKEAKDGLWCISPSKTLSIETNLDCS